MWRKGSLALLAGLLLVGPSLALVVSHASGTPMEKVITLLETLSKEVYDEGNKEAVAYDKFSCFCQTQAEQKVAQIEKEDARIERLNAAMTEENGMAQYFTNEGGVLRTKIGLSEEEQRIALEIRMNQTYTYQHRKLDLESAIQATTRAIAVMESAVASAKEVTAMVQTAKEAILKVSEQDHLSLTAENSTETTGADPLSAIKGPVYKYKSGDMVGVMKGLDRSFRMDLARLELEEGNLQSDYNNIEGARAYQLAAFRRDRDEKERVAAEQIEYWRRDQGLSDEEKASRAADQAYLDDLTSQCTAKAADWDQRSKARASELTVIEQAIELLSGMKHLYSVTGLVTKTKPTVSKAAAIEKNAPVTLRSAGSAKAISFVQVQAIDEQKAQPLIKFLQGKAQSLKSAALFALASQLSTEGDHFVKVRQLLKDLMQRLTDDAAAEANQKGFCDEQMNIAVTSRDQKKEQMENLHADIDAAKIEVTRLQKEIKRIQEDIAELHESQVEVSLMRAQDKANNEKTLEDASSGLNGVMMAKMQLESFYSTSFLQSSQAPSTNSSVVLDRNGVAVQDLAPETFTGAYEGKGAQTAGIMGLLNIVISDFQHTMQSTKADEIAAVQAYEREKARISDDLLVKGDLLARKQGDLAEQEAVKTDAESSLRDAAQLHSEALESLEALKSSCVENSESREAREKARKAEIDALKQAAQILEEWK